MLFSFKCRHVPVLHACMIPHLPFSVVRTEDNTLRTPFYPAVASEN